MPATSTAPPVTADDEPPVRNRLLIIVVALVLGISLAVAAVVIFSSDTDPVPAEDPVAAVSAGEEGGLLIGTPNARLKIIVREDFGSTPSREFGIASRDFLRIEAADGDVNVTYYPVSASGTGFSASAETAWETLLQAGTPRQTLAFQDLLFDQQADADDPASRQLVALAERAGVKDSKVLDDVAAALVAEESRATRPGTGIARGTPTVFVDHNPLTAASPTDLADALQRLVLEATS